MRGIVERDTPPFAGLNSSKAFRTGILCAVRLMATYKELAYDQGECEKDIG
jgi:hypothetical protein